MYALFYGWCSLSANGLCGDSVIRRPTVQSSDDKSGYACVCELLLWTAVRCSEQLGSIQAL